MVHNNGTNRIANHLPRQNLLKNIYSRLYLNMQPTVSNWSSSGDEFSLVWDQCPLSEWVEMPSNCSLKYCALIPGAIRGALQMVQLDVQCWFVQVIIYLSTYVFINALKRASQSFRTTN